MANNDFYTNITVYNDVIATDGTDTATLSETGLALSRDNSYIQSTADNADTLNIGQSSVRWGHVKLDSADFIVLNGGNERFKIDSSGDATFAGDVILGDDKELIFGGATDFKIYHNSTTNVNHVSSLLDRQLSINGNIIKLTNQANSTTYLNLESTGATFAGEVTIDDIPSVGSDTDKFLMSNSGLVSYATGAEVLSYIGAGTGSGTVTSVQLTGGEGVDVSVTSGANPITTTGNLTLKIDLDELTTTTNSAFADFFPVVNSSAAQYKIAPGDIDLSTMNNDSGWTTNTGTVTSVGYSHAGNAFTVDGQPVTSSGTIAVTMAGSSSQYIDGAGNLATSSALPFVDGSGTANTITKWSDTDTVTDSSITDDGTDVNFTSPIIITDSLADYSTPFITLWNNTNGGGAGIEFSDQASTQAQKGYLTFYHSDGSSQGGGASMHLTSTETDFVVVAGGPLTNGRFSVYSGANNAEPDYGFYDDQDTGMLRPSANAIRFVTGGTASLDINSSQQVTLSAIPSVGSDTDKFLMSNGGTIAYATGAEVLSYIGAGTGSGTVTGTGVDNRLAIWNGTTAIDSDSDFYVDGNTIFTVNLEATTNVSAAVKVITPEVESSGTLLLDAAADITIDAGGGDIILSDDTTIFGTISSSSGMQIRSRVNNADMFLRGVGDGVEFDALTLDMSDSGTAIFNHHLSIPDYIVHTGDASTRFGFSGASTFVVNTGGTTALTIDSSQDVGIGGTPNFRLGVSNAAASTAVYQQFTNGTTGTASGDGTVMGIDSDGDFLINNQEAKEFKVYTSDTIALTIDSSQDATFEGTITSEDITSGNIRINEASNPNLQLYRSDATTQLWELSVDSSGRLLFQEAASSGGTQYTRMTIDDPGNITFGAYGSGSFTGTSAYYIIADSSGNLVEKTPAEVLSDIGAGTGTMSSWIAQTDSGAGAAATVSNGDTVILTSGNSTLDITNSGTSASINMPNSGVTAGSYTSAAITVDAQGRVTAASSGSPGDITAVTTTTPISGGGTTGSVDISHATSGVTAGSYTYTNLTVNATGHITAASSGSSPGTMSSFTLTGDSGSNQTIENGNTLDVAGGTGIATVVGATDTVTVNLSAAGAGAGNYGSTSDTIKIDEITLDAYGRVTAVTTGATGDMTGFGVAAAVGGSSFTISNGQTMSLVGGTAITSVFDSGDESITFNLDNTAVTAASYTLASITVDAQGRITAASSGSAGGTMSSFEVAGDSGSSQTITNGNTLDIAGGTKISTVASATDTLTVGHDTTSRSDTASSTSPGSAGTFTAVDSVTTDTTGHITALNLKTVTMPTVPTSDNYNYWTLAGDSGSSQTISSTNTATIAGGTGLSSVASATDTVTLNLDNTAVTAGSYTSAAITVDAQGRITAASSGSPGDVTGVTASTNNSYLGITVANSSGPIPDVGINLAGLTELSATPADEDVLLIYDEGVPQNKKITVANLIAAAPQGDITGVTAGTYLSGGGTSGTVTLNHDATSRTDTTSTTSPGSAGTFTSVDSVTTNATGHLTALNLKTVTMPTVPTVSGVYLPLAGGTMTGDAVFNDDVKIKMGTGGGNSDIYHNGTDMYIRQLTAAGDMSFAADSTGAGGSSTTYFALDGGQVLTRFYKGANFNDDVKLTFGDVAVPGDLEIWHDEDNSYITDTGTGSLKVGAANFHLMNAAHTEYMMTGTPDEGMILYYDNSTKFQTTSAGVTVTGDLIVSGGDITVASGHKIISNSGVSTTLVIGDVDGNDTTSQIEFHSMATNQMTIDDGEVIFSSELSMSSGYDIRLNGDSNILLDTSIAANQSSGTVLLIGSTSVTVNKVYYWTSGSAWALTDADAESTSTGLIAYAANTGTASSGRMVTSGVVFSSGHSFTIGAPLYLSTVAGALTTTAPSGNNDVARVVGYAITTDEIYFSPDNTWVTISV